MNAKTRKIYNPFSWDWKLASEIVREYSVTLLVLVYIVNGLATLLILFNQVDANEFHRHLVGATAFAYSFLALILFVNRGVKNQSKKGKK